MYHLHCVVSSVHYNQDHFENSSKPLLPFDFRRHLESLQNNR
ncbi:unnamed protein product [Brugia timori]|uniref:Uncharacterized protein n=1 Tax=Brugia timori TaxID=42155 RepID=A0A3P7XNA3_9BILA|nr:unnamed protein product [Brugia timori]